MAELPQSWTHLLYSEENIVFCACNHDAQKSKDWTNLQWGKLKTKIRTTGINESCLFLPKKRKKKWFENGWT